MWQTERKRSLVLSYNKALVVDIQRTMCLLGMEKDLKDGIIQTIHSFIWHLFKVLGEDNLEDDFLDKYDEKKDELLQFIETKTISSEELNKIKKNILIISILDVFVSKHKIGHKMKLIF